MKKTPIFDYQNPQDLEKLLAAQKIKKQRISILLPKPIVKFIDRHKQTSRGEYIAQSIINRFKKAHPKSTVHKQSLEKPEKHPLSDQKKQKLLKEMIGFIKIPKHKGKTTNIAENHDDIYR